MFDRPVEDRLREEYFQLLPQTRRVAEQLETEIRHSLLPISLKLQKYERIVVTSRIKDCEGAIEALRRRQIHRTFERDPSASYTLTQLPDLAGVRVLAFPRSRLLEIDTELRKKFDDWTSDPVPPDEEAGEPLAFKYHGYCNDTGRQVQGEYQVISMLVGLFWEVEHGTIYKPVASLEYVSNEPKMKACNTDVLRALRNFEAEFERLVKLEPFRSDYE